MKAGSTALKRSGSERPQRPSRTFVVPAKAKDLDPLASYLNKLLDGPTSAWPKAERIGDVLERYKTILDACYNLKTRGWSRSLGGYEFPDGISSSSSYVASD